MQVSEGVYWVGALDPDLRVFDIIMKADYGTTYNAYLVKGEKTALIDTVKSAFSAELISRLEKLIKLEELDYIILNHTEPDHCGALAELLQRAPRAQVLGSRAACKFAAAIVNAPLPCRAVGDGEELDLGGKRLRFIHAPFLHWPDSIFTYLPEEEILFTCDVFGAHYCGSCQVFCDQARDLDEEFKYYFDHILRPFKEHLLRALDKVQGLPLRIIAPSHGPILRRNLVGYFERYRRWCGQEQAEARKKAVIAYVSAYGNTAAMAEAIRGRLQETGVPVSLYDAAGVQMQRLRDEVEQARALILGSPTINADAVKPIWEVINSLATIKLKGKIGAAFGSFAWSGEAVPMLTGRMKDLKMKVLEPGLRLQLVPDEQGLRQCRRFADQIAALMS